jgi:hypothetical protein
MKLHSRIYTAYSIGCGAAWSGILAVAAAEASEDTRRAPGLVFPGWAGGWLSAAIARGRVSAARVAAAGRRSALRPGAYKAG